MPSGAPAPPSTYPRTGTAAGAALPLSFPCASACLQATGMGCGGGKHANCNRVRLGPTLTLRRQAAVRWRAQGAQLPGRHHGSGRMQGARRAGAAPPGPPQRTGAPHACRVWACGPAPGHRCSPGGAGAPACAGSTRSGRPPRRCRPARAPPPATGPAGSPCAGGPVVGFISAGTCQNLASRPAMPLLSNSRDTKKKPK